jgi:uncharacterized membrane protein YhaH (DUF805 family)
MFSAIRYNLANLGNFKGRDRRSTFWLYILALVIIQVAIGWVISIVLAGSVMGDVLSVVHKGAGGGALQERMIAHITTMLRVTGWVSAIVTVVMIGLVVASFTRRLHDADKPGWIAGLTAVIQLAGIALKIATIGVTVRMLDADQAPVDHARLIAMSGSLFAWLPVAIIVAFGGWPSSIRDNRHGPAPAQG